MRLFLAIFPPKEYLDYFRDVVRKFDKEKRNLKPVNLEQIHLTLRFIGANVSLGSKNRLAKSFLTFSGNFAKPEIKLGELAFGFPRQHDPRVLLADVHENDELNLLSNQIHKLIRDQHLHDTIRWKSKQDTDFHMSLARLKPAATRSTGRNVKAILENVRLPMPESFVAEEMYLMQSTVPRGGGSPVYKKLEKIKL
ncbi:RNA 2',3'-cyclic phosphodiesterase [Candidatus Dojkabacteria bacterium]|uniref:RNA 2',3'-cyclic phosphodiesterase n=1 Tax=Candidatus Dojkabacteria bacterium TaxID=2099670 RepID=A0A955L0K2_9BACT|nr:RNA 2',3'-cyclic phosphodiesterase [Candidatus Dojkabacteria bacterium]